MTTAELIDVLRKDIWEKVDPASMKGLKPCMIGRHEGLENGTWRYAVAEGYERKRKIVHLEGACGKDPLNGVANCEAIIEGDQIVAINVDEDCVRKISHAPAQNGSNAGIIHSNNISV